MTTATAAAGRGAGEGLRRALVIDDDAGIRILVTRILERHELSVDTARDGAEGIEMLATSDYGVIILDMMMPRVDGVAVVRYMAQYCPDKLLHVIVATAFGAGVVEEVSPTVQHFLDKPFDVAELVAHANECCRAS